MRNIPEPVARLKAPIEPTGGVDENCCLEATKVEFENSWRSRLEPANKLVCQIQPEARSLTVWICPFNTTKRSYLINPEQGLSAAKF